MTTNDTDFDQKFMGLIASLHMGAMQQMGKIASPITGKIERNLAMARETIDLLGVLETKTKGNLTKHEETALGRILYELRMNFVDEQKKGETPPEDEAGSSEETETAEESSEAPESPTDSSSQDKPPEESTDKKSG